MLAKFVLAKFVLVKFVLAKFVLTKHIAMSKLFIITFSVMIIFSENIIQHISADVTVATFHEELFGSGNFKISDVVMNSTIILLITTLKFINVNWVVEFLTLDGKISLILSHIS